MLKTLKKSLTHGFFEWEETHKIFTQLVCFTRDLCEKYHMDVFQKLFLSKKKLLNYKLDLKKIS
jgi:hypothetical protein